MCTALRKGEAMGIWLLLGASLGWATTGLFVRLLPADTSPALAAGSRSIGGGASMLLLLLFAGNGGGSGHSLRAKPWLTLAAAITYVFTVGLFIAALQRASTGPAFALHYTAPAFTCLFAWMFGWEKPRTFDFAALVAVLLGSACFFVDTSGRSNLIGLTLALLSGAAWGLSLPLTKRLDARSRMLAMLTAHFVLITWGLVVAAGNGASLLGSWPVHAGMAIFSSALPNVLYIAALARIQSSLKIGLLLLSEPVSAALLGFLFLGETAAVTSVLGYLMLGAAVAVQLTWGSRRRQPCDS